MSIRVKRTAPRSVSASSTADHSELPDHEEIVMTPLKAKVGQIIRVERVSTGIMDGKKVHYFAEGPYKGIVVNKATNVRPYKTAPETMRRFVAYIHDEGETAKEVREIRFWFKRDTDSGQMEDYSSQFFRELISPTDFPKDHLKFVKRVLTLTQKYEVLKFLELEMRPYTSQDDPVDVRGQPFSTDPRPVLFKTKSTIEKPTARHTGSTDDLLGGGKGKRKVRRLTVSGVERARDHANDDHTVPTVFVYKTEVGATDADGKKKKKKKKSGANELVRSEAVENLNFDAMTDDSVFPQANGGSPEIIEMVAEPKVKRKSGPPPTGHHGNPSYSSRTSDSVFPTPVYGVMKKNRRSTETPSPIVREASGSPMRPVYRPSRDTPDGPSHPTPSSTENRRSSRHPKPSADLSPVSAPSRNSYVGPDAPGSTPAGGEAKANGRRGSSNRRKTRPDRMESDFYRDSKIITVLEDAYPTPLSVADLAKHSRMKLEDVEKELARLTSYGVAADVDNGMWVRAQVVRRLKPSSTSKNNNCHSGQDVDFQKNEFRMVASAPSLAAEDQPTIAIITSLYCEKMAVDAMMDVKTTYVKYKTQGEGQLYTVGLIDRHRVVSTKLSKIGRGSEAKLSPGDSIPRLLETFQKIEHVLLVGVGGGVASHDDESNHVRLGDAVISKGIDRKNQFLYFYVTGNEAEESSSITLETRPWASGDSELRSVVGKVHRSPKKLWKQLDGFLEEATRDLEAIGDTSFIRPPADSDQLYRTSGKTETPILHPEVAAGSARNQRPDLPLIHFGAVASGKILTRDDGIRDQFCLQQKAKAVDSGFQKVLNSLENQDGLSFVVVRGISDYSDGTVHKEWQPYAALVAAAVMKCIVMRLPLPEDEEGLV